MKSITIIVFANVQNTLSSSPSSTEACLLASDIILQNVGLNYVTALNKVYGRARHYTSGFQ